MADIRCPHCGKENPDFLDVCQFCQNPLKSESNLRIGENPTKKNTGELENVLPDWLKDARKQARDSAEEDAAYAAAQPKVQKEEPVDLLAGLFQSESSEDEDVPDWLAAINPTAKSKPATPITSADPKPETDFFAQFNKSEPTPATPSTPASEPPQPSQAADDRDQLSDWFIQASEQPAETLDVGPDVTHSDWGMGEQFASRTEETPVAKEEEDLSWLHNLESAAKQTDELRSPKQTSEWGSGFNAPSQTSGDDDLSWLNQLGAIPGSEQSLPQPPRQSQRPEDLSWLDNLGGASSSGTPETSDEDLSWLNKLGGAAPEPPASKPAPKEDLSWLNAFSEDAPQTPQPTPPQSSSKEDLSWLTDMGATPIEQPATKPEKPQQDLSWLNAFSETPESSQPAATPAPAEEDLSWLSNLGATPIETPSAQPEKPQEDLSWLNAFSETPESSQPVSAEPAFQDDLNWLNNLGGTSVENPPPQPDKPQEDLSWLNAFGSAPESTQPAPAQASSQDDLSWLNSLQGEPDTLSSAPSSKPADEIGKDADAPRVSPFVPRQTAPLDENAQASIPDWLKSATEGPSMPMGTEALDQFREDYKVPSKPEEPFSWKSFTQEAKPAEEQPQTSQPEPAFFDDSFFAPAGESTVPSTEDVNSLFSVDMPDWLSQAEPTQEALPAQDIGIHAEGGEALAPVDLPSWVQAMRPMDAVISDAAPSIDDQPTEREGPLAGFRGVLPAAPLGSARRPRPISLKLQASDEQQASAALLEQLLAGETSPRPLVSTPVLGNQRILRWVLTALFILVIGGMIGMRSQMFTISAPPLGTASGVTNALQAIPDGSNVLVVVDYEPALAGEMEAVSGPMLDQLTLLRHPNLSFVATSPNGSALAERLMTHTGVSVPSQSNLGYLAGSETGVLTFLQSPRVAMPDATINAFSEYSAVILLTDNAESARIWIEQLQNVKQRDSMLALQPLLVAASAQAGPLLQPYNSSRQVTALITGLSDASRFEFMNNSRPGIARSYWDAFGVGLIMAVGLIVLGSLWSVFAGIRARRADATEG